MRVALVIAVSCLLAGCNGPETDGSDRSMTGEHREKFFKALEANLFDGKSARLKDIRRVQSDSRYCGYLNAKNRMGAYTGWQLFSFSAYGSVLGVQEQGQFSLDTNACAWTKHYRGEPLDRPISHSGNLDRGETGSSQIRRWACPDGSSMYSLVPPCTGAIIIQ